MLVLFPYAEKDLQKYILHIAQIVSKQVLTFEQILLQQELKLM
jgi:hypothetical protein